MVAKIWANILINPGARYKYSFDRIVFAVLGNRTFPTFKDAFENRHISKTSSAMDPEVL